MYLAIEDTTIDTPLIDPSLSKVTELLMNMNILENPIVALPTIRNAMTIRKNQNNQVLEEGGNN